MGSFVDDGGMTTAFVLVGDAAPDTGGGTYSQFGIPDANADGTTVFHAVVSGGTSGQGVFRRDGGTQSAVVLQGQAAPSVAGGIYSNFGARPRIDGAGRIAFFSNLATGPIPQGIFVRVGPNTDPVALPGNPVPGTGGSYASVGSSFDKNESRQYAFVGQIQVGGGPFTLGVFRTTVPTPTPSLGTVAVATLVLLLLLAAFAKSRARRSEPGSI